MNKIDERFLTLVRSSRMKSFYAAHKIIDTISTPVLYSAALELVSRARYLLIVDTPENADHANQLASQIAGVLKQRNEDVTLIDTKVNEIIHMMY